MYFTMEKIKYKNELEKLFKETMNPVLKQELKQLQHQPYKRFGTGVLGGMTPIKTGLSGKYKGIDLKNQGEMLNFADDDNREGFTKYMIDIANVLARKTALSEGTGSLGGYMVPEEYAGEIMGFAREKSFALRDCKIVNMKSDTMRVPTEATSVSVSYGVEGSTLDETNPTIGEVVLNAERLGAWTSATNELLQDAAENGTDVVSWLGGLFAEALGQEVDDNVMNGGALESFTGALSGAGHSVVLDTRGSYENITIQDLSEMIAQLSDNQMGSNPKFYMEKKVWQILRDQQDSSGQLIFDPTASISRSVYGYPIIISDVMPTPNTSGGADPFVLFGDLKHYLFGNRLNRTQLEIDPYGLFTSYKTRFRMVWRVCGEIGLANGLVSLYT